MLRTCNRRLPQDCGKERPCLNYHIKQCCAPCQGYISKEEYALKIDKAIDFLNGKHQPVIKDLNLKFKSDPVSYTVGKITVPDENELSFTNPKTKAKHTLKILSCDNESFPINFRDELSYPDKALLVNYTITPDFESRALSLIDTKRSEQPKRIKKEKYVPEATHDAVIGIIGGADGPTAISVSRPIKKEAEGKSHQAASSLHFSEVKSAEFRLVLSLNDNMEDEIKLY